MTPRLQKLASKLPELSVDAMLVTDEINVGYLSGFTGDSSYLLVQSDAVTIISDGRYETQIASECPDLTAVIRYSGEKMIDSVKSVINDSGAKRVAIESTHMSLSEYRNTAKVIRLDRIGSKPAAWSNRFE